MNILPLQPSRKPSKQDFLLAINILIEKYKNHSNILEHESLSKADVARMLATIEKMIYQHEELKG